MVHIDSDVKRIAIIGLPAAGKTYVSNKIKEKFLPDATLVHTDEIDDGPLVIWDSQSYIIEGCRVYDLLLNNNIKPDLVVNVISDDATREARYKERGKDRPVNFEAHLNSQWKQFVDKTFKARRRMPKYLEVQSNAFDI